MNLDLGARKHVAGEPRCLQEFALFGDYSYLNLEAGR